LGKLDGGHDGTGRAGDLLRGDGLAGPGGCQRQHGDTENSRGKTRVLVHSDHSFTLRGPARGSRIKHETERVWCQLEINRIALRYRFSIVNENDPAVFALDHISRSYRAETPLLVRIGSIR